MHGCADGLKASAPRGRPERGAPGGATPRRDCAAARMPGGRGSASGRSSPGARTERPGPAAGAAATGPRRGGASCGSATRRWCAQHRTPPVGPGGVGRLRSGVRTDEARAGTARASQHTRALSAACCRASRRRAHPQAGCWVPGARQRAARSNSSRRLAGRPKRALRVPWAAQLRAKTVMSGPAVPAEDSEVSAVKSNTHRPTRSSWKTRGSVIEACPRPAALRASVGQ